MGYHTGLSGHDHQEALIQNAEIKVCRDLDKNYKREGDRVYSLSSSINQHGSHDMPVNDIRMASAGCLVGRTDAGHRQFMQLVKSDPRYHLVSTYYKFMTTIISGEDLRAAFS